MENTNSMTAEQLLNLLMTQSFANFYKGELEGYIIGEEDAMSREDIINDLQELMNFRR
jgi:hypothetical protein